MKLFRNKRGDIPITILVLGVFVICVAVIFSFRFFDIKNTKNFYDSIEALENMNSEIQKYHFYTNANIESSKIEKFLEIKKDNKGSYIEVKKDRIIVKYYLP